MMLLGAVVLDKECPPLALVLDDLVPQLVVLSGGLYEPLGTVALWEKYDTGDRL